MATSKILVADSVGGLLVGAILERMIDNSQEDFGGRVFAMLDGDTPNFDIVREMNFPEGVVEKKLEVLPWSRLEPGPNEDDPIPEPPNPEDETAMHRHNRKIAAIAKTKAARKNLELASFDGLAVACQFDSLEVLNKLTPFLGYSRPIVVYSQYKESLIPAYLMMRASPDYVNAQLTETMTREYQVPVSGLGTHPFMMTSGTGGFLLTATRVYAGDCAVASATHAMKRRQRAEAGAGAEDGDETAGAGAGPKDRKSKLTNHTEGPKKQRKI
ncbi:tRNA (adenine(58)-N(1))-methyltransferase non-catalytic subunit trm6 [Entophlyctis sp. JEL0112]|nr:tRNA (adenine(58)-N(1))-methyltransferase non-catalytic subunit trm6 [Entophlyctis sp. JEL0112]